MNIFSKGMPLIQPLMIPIEPHFIKATSALLIYFHCCESLFMPSSMQLWESLAPFPYLACPNYIALPTMLLYVCSILYCTQAKSEVKNEK